MIGQVLGGRYEVLERIGGGGMALVYKGLDILLNRKVAIKVLRQQYVNDEEFIRRFRREAQSAASLSHPNVVSIYDVGQEGDTHYIVMEYIEGINLNERILMNAPLQVEEAVHIAGQICDALDHAHHNQIIHRDIKPHNILIGKNGRIKVTDFGIARAVTSSTITQTGAVLGSVHYFSPEHAKGVSTGEKSDLYSLGIVLYQMLTGKLPFLGESPISVALKHLQENVEDPRKINPLIPQSVENIILKAMRKNPEERYNSASEMQKDLETSMQPGRRNEKKSPYMDDDETDEHRTLVIPAIRGDKMQPFNSAPKRYTQEEDKAIKKKIIWIKPLVWMVITVLLLAAMWYGVKEIQKQFVVPDVDIPNVVGMKLDEAKTKLQQSQLVLNEPVIYQFSDTDAKDVVMKQDKSNIKVKAQSAIILTVSKGGQKSIMPGLVGQNLKDTMSQLISLGIKEVQITKEEFFNDAAPGMVLTQTPNVNDEFDPKNVKVHLTVSKGKESFEMPNLIGLTEIEAKSRVLQNNLKLSTTNIKHEPSYASKGIVFKQWPFDPGAAVSPGQDIVISVSSGYPKEAVTYNTTIQVSPAADGKESTIKIVYSDARGDNVVLLTKKITKTQTFPVTLVLSPSKDGSIELYRDEEKLNTSTVTYTDAKKNDATPASSIPADSSTSGGTP